MQALFLVYSQLILYTAKHTIFTTQQKSLTDPQNFISHCSKKLSRPAGERERSELNPALTCGS